MSSDIVLIQLLNTDSNNVLNVCHYIYIKTGRPPHIRKEISKGNMYIAVTFTLRNVCSTEMNVVFYDA